MILKKIIKSNGGYTLLEIGLVLFILLLIAGISVPVISGLLAEERLRQPAKELRLYATTARRLAISEDRPYAIFFTKNGFLLEPYLTGKQKDVEITDSYKMASTISYSLQRRGDKQFNKPDEETWVFQPMGICEPLRVHFQNKEGWLEFAFNPLTARAQDESYNFP